MYLESSELPAVVAEQEITAPINLAQRLVAAFLAGRTAETLRTYRQCLDDFATFMAADSAEDASQWLLFLAAGEANALVLDYRNFLTGAEHSAATMNLRLAAVRSLVKMARMTGLISWTIEVQGLKAEAYRDARGVGRTGYKRLLEELDKRTDRKGVRDRAILRLMYELALRRIEITRLDLEDVDIAGATLQVLGKGRNAKEPLTLPPTTLAALQEWLSVRGPALGPLFTNLDRAGKGGHNGRRISAVSINRIVGRLGKDAEMVSAVRPHGLRHAAITVALELTNGNVRAVAKFSRHRSISVVMRYDDARDDMAARSPN
jgi:integrase/recombinase XerC